MSVEDALDRLRDLAGVRRRSHGTAAEVTADTLRELIMEGGLRPGDRVVEESLLEPLEISRNTLREAFRLLAHEKLIEHKVNRGVFVRALTADDVSDLFTVRVLIELTALRRSREPDWTAMAQAVDEGRARAAAEDWLGVGTANMRFHKAIVASVGSARLDELMSQLTAELRLGFHEMGDPRAFHEKYLTRNAAIADSVREGDIEGAVAQLREYLDDAKAEMLAAFG
ncbi:GntR family transcriptional regulator [Actinokineospora diospyrosa]|uniref:DNA-binding transcriptional regulator, GntR family n=1 Tax=Actinokineospora diospyrosa TaxID=103728 RepID=A0ABT1ID79_9PSEU|nr:GntR family transcriptional regulator [Actinokineospora diospyrosa]MCP2270594.1 DNA-binding transcriptional regulator, GntR family [Actinokineospora diospyrosa]